MLMRMGRQGREERRALVCHQSTELTGSWLGLAGVAAAAKYPLLWASRTPLTSTPVRKPSLGRDGARERGRPRGYKYRSD